MLLRILFSAFLICTISSTAICVNTIPHPVPQKSNFFQRLQEKVIAKKVKKFTEKFFVHKCDIVILKNGDEIDVTVTQISNEKVHYKACDTEGKATDHFDVQEVFMIKYANGERFVFEKNNLIQVVHTEHNTSGGFALGFLLGAVLGLIGIIIIAAAFRGDRKRNALYGALFAFVIMGLILFAFLSTI